MAISLSEMEPIGGTPITTSGISINELEPISPKPVIKEANWWDTVSVAPGLAASNIVESAAGVADIVGADKKAKEWRQDAAAARKYVDEAYPVDPNSWKGAARNAATSIYTQAPGMALGLLTGGSTLPLTIMGTQAGTQKMSELTDAGVEKWKAVPLSMVSGAIEAFTEKIPFEKFIDIAKVSKGRAANIVKMMLYEQGGEQLATLGDQVIDLVKPDASWSWEDYKKAIIQTAKTTLLQTGTMATVAATINKAAETVDRRRRKGESTPPVRSTTSTEIEPIVTGKKVKAAKARPDIQAGLDTLKEESKKELAEMLIENKQIEAEQSAQAKAVKNEEPINLEDLEALNQYSGKGVEADTVIKNELEGLDKLNILEQEQVATQQNSVQNLNKAVVEQTNPEEAKWKKARQIALESGVEEDTLTELDKLPIEERKSWFNRLSVDNPTMVSLAAEKITEDEAKANKIAKWVDFQNRMQAKKVDRKPTNIDNVPTQTVSNFQTKLGNHLAEVGAKKIEDLTDEQLDRTEQIVEEAYDIGLDEAAEAPLNTKMSDETFEEIAKRIHKGNNTFFNKLYTSYSKNIDTQVEEEGHIPELDEVPKEVNKAATRRRQPYKVPLEDTPENRQAILNKMDNDIKLSKNELPLAKKMATEIREGKEKEDSINEMLGDSTPMTDREASEFAKQRTLDLLEDPEIKTNINKARSLLSNIYKFRPDTEEDAVGWLDRIRLAESTVKDIVGHKKIAFTRKAISKAVANKDISPDIGSYMNKVFNLLKVQPTFNLNWLERKESESSEGLYDFAQNLIKLRNPYALAHEVGHFAWYNVLTSEDRIAYMQHFINTYYTGNNLDFSKLRLDTTNPGNAVRNPAEAFACKFSDYTHDKVFSKIEMSLMKKVQAWFSELKNRLVSRRGQNVTYNGVERIFDKVLDKQVRRTWSESFGEPVTEQAIGADVDYSLAFFKSKLEDVVKVKPFTKMDINQLKKMLENNGVTRDEISKVLDGLEGVVTRDEVLDAIKVNKTEFDDVVLGEPRITEKVNMSPDRAYGLYKEGMISADDYAQAEKTGFIEKSIKRPVHYEQYSEPGYIPGSYREIFVTAPSEGKETVDLTDPFHVMGFGPDKYESTRGKWQDGHLAYSNIQNPVVRLRTNDREVNGKKILFVEEMQGPSKENQDKMPEYLRKRIYDIGVKRVIKLAKEKGYDGVAWTTGEMQASRYDLSKHVDKVTWGTGSMSKEKVPTIYLKDHTPIHIEMDNEGIIRGTSEGSFVGEKLENVVGKDIAKRILSEDSGELKGLDLKVGGEGLKYLYDKQLPSLFKKYGKEVVGDINIFPEEKQIRFMDLSQDAQDIVEKIEQEFSGRPLIYKAPIINQGINKLGYKLEITSVDDVINANYYNIKGEDKVPYIPITPKTPGEFALYSDPFGLQTMYNRVKLLVETKKNAERDSEGRKILATIKQNDWGLAAPVDDKTVVNKDQAGHWERVKRSFLRPLLQSPSEIMGTILENHVFNINTAEHNIGFMYDIHSTSIDNIEADLIKDFNILERGFANLGDRFTDERIKQTYKNVIDIAEGKKTNGTQAEIDAAAKIRAWLDIMKDKQKAKLMKAFKQHLSKTEYNALLDLLSGISPDHIRVKFPKLSLDVLTGIAKEYQEISNWGLENYIPHMMRGQYKIVTIAINKEGKPYQKLVSVGFTEDDAVRKAADYLSDPENKDKKLFIDTSFKEFDNTKTSLNRKQYYAIMNKLAKQVKNMDSSISNKLAKEMARRAVKGQFSMKPTDTFSPFLQDREDILPGEDNIFPVLKAYAYSMEKKWALDDVIDLVRKDLGKMTTEQREWITEYIDDVKGRYGYGDKVLDDILGKRKTMFGKTIYEGASTRTFSRTMGKVRALEANIKFGYRPVAGFVNLMSGQGHVWVKRGAKLWNEGRKFLNTDEGKALIKEVERSLGTSVQDIGDTVKSKTPMWKPMGLFQAPESINRKMSVACAYLDGVSQGMTHAEARTYAIRACWAEQFTYNIANLPRIMRRSPAMRTFLQFKPYLIKEIEFMSNLSKGEALRYIGLQLALGGPRGAIMIAKTIPILMLFNFWQEFMDDAEEWMMKNTPNISMGVGGLPGLFDNNYAMNWMGPATIQFPSKASDLAGPFVGDLMRIASALLNPVKELSTAGSIFPIYKHWKNIWDLYFAKDNILRDDRGNTVYEVKDFTPFIMQSLLGIENANINRFRTSERILSNRDKRDTAEKTKHINNIMQYIADGKPIPNEELLKAIKHGVTVESLRNRVKKMNLTPRLRAVVNAEIRKRYEVFEAFPDESDSESNLLNTPYESPDPTVPKVGDYY